MVASNFFGRSKRLEIISMGLDFASKPFSISVFESENNAIGAAMRLVGLLVWQYRNLQHHVHQTIEAQKIAPFIRKKLDVAKKLYSVQTLDRCYSSLLGLDLAFKGQSKQAYLDPKLHMQRWLAHHCINI